MEVIAYALIGSRYRKPLPPTHFLGANLSSHTPGEASPQIITILSRKSIHEALLARVNDSKFEGRDTYVGGSEIGGCAREVAWKKVDLSRSEIKDPWAAGRILAGKILENAIVQLVRDAFDGVVRETGRAQAELSHPTAPLKCHPDGRLNWKVEWVPGMKIVYLDENGAECFLESPLEGPGTMEIKTCSGHVYKRYVKGLPPRYLDQTQTEMGLSGTGWTLLVLVNRENMAEFVSFLLFFKPERFNELGSRAATIIKSVQTIKQACDGFSDPKVIEAEHLPTAEPERGYCSYCDHKDDCPEYAVTEVDLSTVREFPADVALDAECMAEELRELRGPYDRYKEVNDKLRGMFVEHQVKSAYGFMLQASKGRTTLDSKALESSLPEIFKQYSKTGDPSYSLKAAKSFK